MKLLRLTFEIEKNMFLRGNMAAEERNQIILPLISFYCYLKYSWGDFIGLGA